MALGEVFGEKRLLCGAQHKATKEENWNKGAGGGVGTARHGEGEEEMEGGRRTVDWPREPSLSPTPTKERRTAGDRLR